ncbi:type II toxin-antitoxin system PemK/MazF family toxin [Streptococcus ruminantium]|nr:type II toxin-antitoxin system PemK/MazF family toxin [Streptococcus ruminantium]
MSIDSKIDKASRKFKFVSKSKKLKFRYLPDWVLSEATYFEKEVTGQLRNHKIYKRGSLVFIDFGVNVGNELSGHHFGIVLNKKDSKRNGVLTVVPVSSKSNKFSVQLDGIISQKSSKYLRDSLIDIEIDRKILILHKIKDNLTEDEKCEITRTYSLDNTSWTNHHKYITSDDFEKSIRNISQELDELRLVINSYSKFDKISYAKCLDVRTISKNRIIKINQFDPVGKISVSTETLDKIDQVITQNFTNISLDSNSER